MCVQIGGFHALYHSDSSGPQVEMPVFEGQEVMPSENIEETEFSGPETKTGSRERHS